MNKIVILVVSFVLIVFWQKKDTIHSSWIDHAVHLSRSRERLPILLIELLLVIQLFMPPVLQINYASQGLSLLGILIVGMGAFLAIWARRVMNTNWGVPAEHNITKQKHLVTKGPFQFSRNPIYVGLMFMFVGIELVLQSWLVFLTVLIILYFDFLIRKEEKLLSKYFGMEYEQYKKHVRRYL